jgi:hypothetical protein
LALQILFLTQLSFPPPGADKSSSVMLHTSCTVKLQTRQPLPGVDGVSLTPFDC